MKKLTVLALMLAFVGCSHLKPHPRPWTKGEKVLLCFSVAAAGADYYTTERCLDRGYEEMNPVLGKHPTDTELTLIGWGCYAAIIGVLHLYPELRTPVLFCLTPVNAGFAAHNSTLREDLNR